MRALCVLPLGRGGGGQVQALHKGWMLHGRCRGGNLEVAMAVATALATARAGQEIEGNSWPWITLCA